jgi:glycosyltransferase involved in cell wall biosynthesis
MKDAGSSALRIGFDQRRIGWTRGTGVHRFRDGLHAAIAGMAVTPLALTDAPGDAPKPRVPAIPLLGPANPRPDGAAPNERLFPDLFRRVQSHFTLSGGITEVRLPEPPEIIHWSHPVPLFVRGAANIYTVHDLIPLERPDLTAMSGARLTRLLREILPRAAHVMTVSETVRHALGARFDVTPDRITCCYQPVAAPEPGGVLPAPLVRGGFLLCLGRFEPRKNVARLIEAYLRAAASMPLVFVGPDGDWPDQRERRRVMALIDGRHVMRLGWQDQATVDALIAQCHALLMPSLAEGFGLPVIEAMSAGVPTMASARGAGAEIAGDAALCVDPDDVTGIAAGILSLIDDRRQRAELRRKGIERAAHFSPKVFGDRLAALYEKISGRAIR